VDRLDDSIGYTESNLYQVTTWRENKRRGEIMRGNGSSKSPRYKQVHQFDLEGNYVATYHSARAAHLALGGGGTNTHILQVCEDARAVSLGFTWSYDKEGRDVPAKLKRKDILPNGRAICGVNEDDYIELPSAHSSREICKIQIANIQKCLKGERPKAGGYSWMFLDEYNKSLVEEIESKTYESKPTHFSQIKYDEDTCLVSIDKGTL
jgi:hypothetical protein